MFANKKSEYNYSPFDYLEYNSTTNESVISIGISCLSGSLVNVTLKFSSLSM